MSARPDPHPSSPESGNPSPSRLLARAARGDEDALLRFYDLTCERAYGLAIRILGDAAAADEVLQDVYCQVWQRASTFDLARGSAWSWLLTMTRSRAIDYVRARGHREPSLEEALPHAMDPHPDPEASALLADRSKRVRAALYSLNPDQREAIELAFFEGMTHAAIAERLHLPLGTVKTRIRLGVQALATRLRIGGEDQ